MTAPAENVFESSIALNQGGGPRSTWIGRWLWAGALVTVLLILALLFALVHRRESRISRANYASLRTGMNERDIQRLLGPPDFAERRLALVTAEEGAGGYTINSLQSSATLRKRGFADYRFLQWTSPQLTIHVVTDGRGELATRYKSSGQEQTWTQRLAHALGITR